MTDQNSFPTPIKTERPTIGFLNMDISGDWSMWPWQGIVDAAEKRDVNLVAYIGKTIAQNRIDEQANVLYQFAKDARLDGLIIWKAGTVMMLNETEAESFLRQYHVPIATMEGSSPGLPCVSYENYQGMKAAVDHLVEVHGFTRIGFLGMYEHHKGFQDRYRGYEDAMHAHGLTIDPILARPWFDPKELVGATIVDNVLDAYLDAAAEKGMQAVIGIADPIAIQVQQRLQQRGTLVPDEIAVVGFDGFPNSIVLTPSITSATPSWYEFGQLAAETLIDMLEGKSAPAEVLAPSRLMVRQSCGCQDESVRLAGETNGNMGEREEIISWMAQAARTSKLDQIEQIAANLFERFLAETSGSEDGSFLKALEHGLHETARLGGEISPWHDVISVLRQHTTPPAKKFTVHEKLLQQARVMIGHEAEHAQAAQCFQATQQENQLRTISQRLITALNVDKLLDVLAEELPGIGIPSCYVSIFEDTAPYTFPNHAPEWARLLLAYDQKGRKPIQPGGQRFLAQGLIPDEYWPEDRVNFAVLALYVQEEPLGFIVFDGSSRNGVLFEALRVQVSSALQGAILMQRIQERSAELAQQHYILDMFMENVPDSIYFKDAESRFTRMNKACLGKLGLSNYTDVLGKTDFDFFPEEQAQPKYEQEQQIIKTGQPMLNLEEPDSDGSWALTTKMPFRDEKNRIIGTFGISRNITDLIKAKQTAEAAKDEALQARKEALAEKETAEKAKKVAEIAKEEAEKAKRETEEANASLAAKIWQTNGQALLNDHLRGEQDIPTLASKVIKQICEYIQVQSGVLYTLDDNLLNLAGTYAYRRKGLVHELNLGEGPLGEAALNKQIQIRRIPDDYIANIFSTTGELLPKFTLTAPFQYEGQTIGVIGMEMLTEFTAAQLEFLTRALESIAIAFMTAQARRKVNELLSQTRQQAEELQAQEEELRATNEELEAQTESLRASETRLKQNQSALEAANTDLEEKTGVLQEQQAALDRQNQILRDAQQELERKANELTLASKYKSEFLANMSHELRTPLNSMLILSGMLAKNEEGNLTPDQMESAQVIYSGGADLLNLINEILDLAKVEAGRMEFHFAPMEWERLMERLHAQFDPVTQRKGLQFITSIADDLPSEIVTDEQRLAQILKNLLSNAFKFTEQGSIQVRIHHPAADTNLSACNLTPATAIAISVTDTGIGMTPEQQKIVFEAFQQADGSTSRQYGGTGLGLTITREMAIRLGGQVALTSEKGKGSTFTIYLPLKGDDNKVTGDKVAQSTTQSPNHSATPSPTHPATQSPVILSPSIPDDRDDIHPGDNLLLIVEDDLAFAKIVLDYTHKKGFKGLHAPDGESVLQLLHSHKPQAIVLDLGLPKMSGWEVLDTLKGNPDTRHIPIHIISAADEDLSAFQRGAIGFLTKPVSQEDLDNAFQHIEQLITTKIKTLLLVEDDDNLRKSVRKLLEGNDIEITETGLGNAALEKLAAQHYDCMILDLSLPDMTGFELLNRLHNDEALPKCPVIVYTGKELSPDENQELLKYADSVIVKGVKSPERLLDETALFLHRVIADLPEDKQRAIRKLHDPESILEGKQILLVDDDTRNAFALSKLLSDKGMKMHIAPNGLKALEALEKVPKISLVLTDIMMPGMDGYELTKHIRQQSQFKRLPIIALTAKAMKGDREKCLEAGANDYLSKPIDPDRLFSMLRVWLSRE